MASAFLEELKPVATEFKKSRIEDEADASCEAWVVEEDPEEDPQGRGIRTLLVAAGAERGGGWGEWKGGGRVGV